MSNKLEAILTMDKKGFTSAIKSVQGDIKGLEKSGTGMSKGMKIAGIAAAAGIGILAVGLADCVKEAMESEKVQAETAAILKTTGGAAKITAGEIENLSGKIRDKTGYDDEAVQSGANMLLTFTNVRNEVGKGNDIFNQAVDLSTDMARKFGMDIPSASKQLGKALQDPIKGVTALRRMGVMLTDQQMNSVKGFVAQGDMLSAQKVILGEVNTEVGLVAEAYGSTFAGKMDIAKSKFGDMKEALGKPIINALLPIMDWINKQDWNAIANKVIKAFKGMKKGIDDVWNAGVHFGDMMGKAWQWLTSNGEKGGKAAQAVVSKAVLSINNEFKNMSKGAQATFGNLAVKMPEIMRSGTGPMKAATIETMNGLVTSIVEKSPIAKAKQKDLVFDLVDCIARADFKGATSSQLTKMAQTISQESGVPVAQVYAMLQNMQQLTRDNPPVVTPRTDGSQAEGDLNSILARMREIARNAPIPIPVISNLPFHGGGLVYHGGGEIPSFDSGGTHGQEVIAKLLRGEYVMQNSAVNKYGTAFMDAINRGLMPTSTTNNTSGPTYVNLSMPNVRTANDAQEIMRVIDGIANDGAHLRRVLP